MKIHSLANLITIQNRESIPRPPISYEQHFKFSIMHVSSPYNPHISSPKGISFILKFIRITINLSTFNVGL